MRNLPTHISFPVKVAVVFVKASSNQRNCRVNRNALVSVIPPSPTSSLSLSRSPLERGLVGQPAAQVLVCLLPLLQRQLTNVLEKEAWTN